MTVPPMFRVVGVHSFAEARNGIAEALEARCEDVFAVDADGRDGIGDDSEPNCVVRVCLRDIARASLGDNGYPKRPNCLPGESEVRARPMQSDVDSRCGWVAKPTDPVTATLSDFNSWRS